MTFSLRRTSDDALDLQLTREHDALAAPRRGDVRWAAFNANDYPAAVLARAASAWRGRALTEMHSLTLFTQLMMQVQQLGAPLDWSGAFARMVSDEARHTDLCLRMKEALGDGAALSFEERDLHLPVTGSLRAHVRQTVLSAFCIGETLSRRMFARCLRVATVPLAKEAVTAILVDETFHSELGWELGALLMRGLNEAELVEERRALVAALPSLYAHFAEQSGVTRDEAHTRAESEVDPEDEGVNFGSLSDAGYARAYFEGMREDVVPGLVAIGLPEAQPAWVEFVAHLK